MSKIVAIIGARSGSKGLQDKNILPFYDAPLLCISLLQAFESGIFDTVYLTSDAQSYLDIASGFLSERAENLGLDISKFKPFLRAKVTDDKTPSYDFIAEVLERDGLGGDDVFCLLQPTSPLRSVKDIKNAYKILNQNVHSTNFQADFVVSFTPSKPRSLIGPIFKPDGSEADLSIFHSKNFTRQAYADYAINGAVYFARAGAYLAHKTFFTDKTRAYVMPHSRSLDIDTALDFDLALYLYRRGKNYMKTERTKVAKNVASLLNIRSFKKPLVCFGNSILAGLPADELAGTQVVNAAIAGSDAGECLDLIQHTSDLQTFSGALLMLGSNDFGTELGKFKTTAENIVSGLQDKGIRQIFITGVPRTYKRLDRQNSRVLELNEILQNIASEKKADGNGAHFIDLSSLSVKNAAGEMELNALLSDDGLHFNAAGYKAFIKILNSNLRLNEK